MGASVDLSARRKDGTEVPADIVLSPLESERGNLVLAVVRDITERRRAEEQSRQAREMFFRELHHRVKNNLQVVSSLLYLQSTHTDDPRTIEVLKESQSRVRSIALIHERLYRSSRQSEIDFPEYVRDLVNDLLRTYGVEDTGVRVRLEVAAIALEVDTAVPYALATRVREVLDRPFHDPDAAD